MADDWQTERDNVARAMWKRRARKALRGRGQAEELEKDNDIELRGDVHGARRDLEEEEEEEMPRWQPEHKAYDGLDHPVKGGRCAHGYYTRCSPQ
jgi:hypothetical protein